MPHHPSTLRAAITDALFAQICRATPEEARDLLMLLTMTEGASLALSCNAHTRLRAQGRAIASACSLASPVKEGGQRQACRCSTRPGLQPTPGGNHAGGKRPVSLAG